MKAWYLPLWAAILCAGCSRTANSSGPAVSGASDTAGVLASAPDGGALASWTPSSDPASPSASAGQGHPWFAGDVNFEHCHQSRSPADRIQEIRDAGEEPQVKETRDSSGSLQAVEVGYYEEGGLEESYRTYYTTMDACEAAIRKDNSIPDEYR